MSINTIRMCTASEAGPRVGRLKEITRLGNIWSDPARRAGGEPRKRTTEEKRHHCNVGAGSTQHCNHVKPTCWPGARLRVSISAAGCHSFHHIAFAV